MLKTIQNAFKIPDIRKKLAYMFVMLVIIRFGSQLPIPGVDPSFIRDWFEQQSGDAFNFFNAMTGGSFTNMSIFALSITPYITSSIIIQLLTIAIPKLEEMQKDGEDGRKKIQEYTRYLTVALALIQSTAMSLGFGGQGLLINFNQQTGMGKAGMVIVAIATMTAGSALLMWIGERITENGIGNGISIVLLFNIISSVPEDVGMLYTRFMSGKTVPIKTVSALIIIAVIVAVFVFVILLQDAERRIPVQYSKKMQGRKMVGGQSSHIPLKVNTAGVIPVIFASSIMSFPVVIAQFFNPDYSTIGGKILMMLNSSSWFKSAAPVYSIGAILYVALIIIFAYFYTSITFNPLEVANNMKKQGGFIPGIRPGKPTSDYLNNLLNYIVFIGAVGLTVICIIPLIISSVFNVGQLSFGGTSLIIIVSVILETLKAIESQMVVRNYKGFLND
ncbi:preprotein translocase subunit SecY [Lachnoclostridium edouardi]|uniref:preprotein translocase subunit SecY n=1 Tax=Lachnoclostridium edouardi TaxID=1926283 RepID=UPI000C7A2B30|nr:preprotein translocase subunit SecY [Lachnoclostridium edouardi]